MANLVYGVTIKGKLFEGIETNVASMFVKSIELADGTAIVVPGNFPLYDTAEERNIAIFKKKRNQLSLNEVALRYNLTIEEVTFAYNTAVERFPEKFI